MARDHKQELESREERFYMMAGMIGSFGAGKFSGGKTEEVTLAMPPAEAEQIDSLIGQGLYSSQQDFLQAAARNLLQQHGVQVQSANKTAPNELLVAGIAIHNRKSLEKLRAAGRQFDLNVTGILRLADDVTPELACAVIRSIKIHGSFQASSEIKEALKDRIR